MPFLHLVYVSRSDGALSTVQGKARRTEDNGPTAEQLRKTKAEKGVYSWYQELQINDPKNLDWRRKLGGMLMKEMHKRAKENGTKPETGPGSESTINPEEYVLPAFPENYRLFEHRRAANLDNTNIRGPNDRRDVYLYGHPQGRKKRFRSPADFLPHLIWLSTDESADPQNCACKLCTPDEMLKAADEMAALQRKIFDAVAATEEKKGIQQTTVTQKTMTQAEAQNKAPPKPTLSQAIPPQNTSTPSHPVQLQVSSTPPPAKTTPMAPQVAVPIPLVTPRDSEQRLDQQLNKFIYRNGELVWYLGTEGHLALGAIISRSLYKDNRNQDKPAYVIQPISYPQNHPSGLITTREQDIKPWLAYSTPPPQIPEAEEGDMSYDHINWEGISRRYPHQALLRAGSICAARMVDASYTLLQLLGNPESGATELEYNGIYLGGEKVWTGEAVRLQTRDDCRDIMIISKIIEKLGSSSGSSVDVEFVGDVYTPATKQHNPNRPLPPNQYLPVRVREDLKFRNQFHTAHLGSVMYWRFTQGQQRLSISKVKGRWYESRLILPATNPNALQEGMKNGAVPDVGDQFNARGPGQNGNIGAKKVDRRLAYSRSLPGGVQFGMPFQAPTREGSVSIDLVALEAQPETSMADFVNMDQMDQRHFVQNFMT